MPIEQGPGSEFEQEEEQPLDQKRRRCLEIIRERAGRGDATFDLQQWFGDEMRHKNPELMEIQRLGFKSEAREWLKSATPEKMKSVGTASREERLAKAQEYADQAGVTLESIAEEYGIELPK